MRCPVPWSPVVAFVGDMEERGMALALIGLGIGLAGSLGLLFGVAASDPLVLASAVLALAAVALAATWLPARRATRVQPSAALRYK